MSPVGLVINVFFTICAFEPHVKTRYTIVQLISH